MTKEYLKMTDAFRNEMRIVGDSNNMLADDVGIIIGCYSGDVMAEYVLHAINSHDELVAENERLRELLSECYPYIKDASDWGGEYDNDLKSRVFDECGVSHDQATSRGGVCQLLSVELVS